jgi:exodeoxyribonuclease VII small subunit
MPGSRKRSRSRTEKGGTPETFEKSVQRLTEIVEQLESGEPSLEDSIALFEEGIELARGSQARLDAAEKRIEELLGIDEEGHPVVREVAPDEPE